MSTAVSRRPAALVLGAGALLAVAALILIAGVISSTGTRSALMSQLQRPAAPGQLQSFSATVHSGPVRASLVLGVNRASSPDRAHLTLTTSGGKPVTGARVTLSYSMPSMSMWRVYSSTLRPDAGKPGSYSATEGALGMAGRWRIAVTVDRANHVTRFEFTDRMPA